MDELTSKSVEDFVAANIECSESINDITEAIKKPKTVKSKTTKVAEARHTRKKASPNLKEQHETPPSLLKLLVVEVLKLPLQILSILLWMLSWVESELRALLDNL